MRWVSLLLLLLLLTGCSSASPVASSPASPVVSSPASPVASSPIVPTLEVVTPASSVWTPIAGSPVPRAVVVSIAPGCRSQTLAVSEFGGVHFVGYRLWSLGGSLSANGVQLADFSRYPNDAYVVLTDPVIITGSDGTFQVVYCDPQKP
jgi:hypothetical protein